MGIARWDGTAWSPLGSGVRTAGGLKALTVYNGELIAGNRIIAIAFSQCLKLPFGGIFFSNAP